MIIVMYLVGLLTGLGIWFLTHCVRSEPQIKVKRDVIYQRLANQGQQPIPPRSAMPPLKKPKKGSCVSDWNGPVPQSRKAPPKPLHNPCK